MDSFLCISFVGLTVQKKSRIVRILILNEEELTKRYGIS